MLFKDKKDAMLTLGRGSSVADVACTAKCVVVPSPDASQANATNECVAACPQGNGTATDNLNYENCVSGCVGRFYFTSTGTPSPTDAAGSNSGGSGSGGSGGSSSVTGAPSSQTGSATGSAAGSASSTSSKAAADIVHVAGPAAGLLGLVAAILAL